MGELQAFHQVTGAGRAAYGAETGVYDDLVVKDLKSQRRKSSSR